jgi:pimeloyl-ACP methyl ester carboxylesterase
VRPAGSAREPGCAGGARDRLYPTWRRDLPALLARTAQRVKVEGVGTVTLDAVAAAKTIQSLTLNPGDAGQVPYVVTRAVHGQYQPLARAAVRSPAAATTGSVPPQLITCNEPWAVRDAKRVAADARGSDLAPAARAWAAEAARTCALVPKQRERAADWRAPQSAAPLLAVVGGADPQDPLANIRDIAKTMPNTRFVLVPGGFHTNAHFGCLPSVVARFVDAGRAAGLQTSCVRTAVRLSWVL